MNVIVTGATGMVGEGVLLECLENPAVERWRKLKGLSRLNRRQLAVVRELYDWRNEVAVRGNRPVRTVVRDDLLAEIARRNPQTVQDLAVLRGLPRHEHEEIVAAVSDAFLG